MTLRLDQKIVRNPEIVSSEIDGETVMMDIDFEKYFGLKEVGTRVWQLLESETTPEIICRSLLDEYDVDKTTCEADLAVFLNELAEMQMIVTAP